MMTPVLFRWLLLSVIVVGHHISLTGASRVGINYGTVGDNLPSPKEAVTLITRSKIPRVRLFEPNHDVLEALRGVKVLVSLGTRNEHLVNLANSPQVADEWVQANVALYHNVRFRWITAGNEVIPGPDSQFVLAAMKNLKASLEKAGLGFIKVTTVVATTVLGISYPPSQGSFGNDSVQIMTDIAKYLQTKRTPLMINVYPYFALVSDPENVALDFALFNIKTPAFNDQGKNYYNLFDSAVDAFRTALAKAVGNERMRIVISETGWPSAGDKYATIENARIYNNNLKKHLLTKGTPAKPEQLLNGFIFALFNENQKPAGVEQNFGCFYPNMTSVYKLW